MAIDMTQFVGSNVRLRSGGNCFQGGISSLLLIEQKYRGSVPVISADTNLAVVEFPTGYKLKITSRDLELDLP